MCGSTIFWMESWPAWPDDVEARCDIAAETLASWPKLIPLAPNDDHL
jgi:hypothetical protein